MRVHSRILSAIVTALSLAMLPAHAWQSTRVVRGADGRLEYPADAAGNRIPDFSHAGYREGGVPLPSVPTEATLAHADGDQTNRIQRALDEVAARSPSAAGHRGALLLGPGRWQVDGTIRLTTSGVVLRGSGDGEDPRRDTLLVRQRRVPDPLVQAGQRNDSFRSEKPRSRTAITTPRVAVGERAFDVAEAGLFQVGQAVVVHHPSTPAWIARVGGGGMVKERAWRPGEVDLRFHRYITAIAGSRLTLDAPVFDTLDRSVSPVAVYAYQDRHVVREVGVESLRAESAIAGLFSEQHLEDAIVFSGVENSWMTDCTVRGFWHAGIQLEGSTRCTVARSRATDPRGPVTGGYHYNFATYHSQLILFRECFASAGRHAFISNGGSLDSGIVVVDSVTARSTTSSEGHRRWSMGLLFDNVRAEDPRDPDVIRLYNRGDYGTSHGWAAAHSVAWACDVTPRGRLVVQAPPTAQNYAIGCSGQILGKGPYPGAPGFIEGSNRAGLEPRSLYDAQLAERLGARRMSLRGGAK
jgi:hypothetical protein